MFFAIVLDSRDSESSEPESLVQAHDDLNVCISELELYLMSAHEPYITKAWIQDANGNNVYTLR
jgi:hypothetical protein